VSSTFSSSQLLFEFRNKKGGSTSRQLTEIPVRFCWRWRKLCRSRSRPWGIWNRRGQKI